MFLVPKHTVEPAATAERGGPDIIPLTEALHLEASTNGPKQPRPVDSVVPVVHTTLSIEALTSPAKYPTDLRPIATKKQSATGLRDSGSMFCTAWRVHYAQLCDARLRIPEGQDNVRCAVVGRALAGGYRFENTPNAEVLHWQFHPLQTEAVPTYHRHGSGQLANQYREALAQRLGISAYNLFPVAEADVLPSVGMVAHVKAVVDFSCWDPGAFLDVFAKLTTSDDVVFLDITPMLAHWTEQHKHSAQELRACLGLLADYVRDYFLHGIAAYAADGPGLQGPSERSQALLKRCQSHVLIGGMVSIGPQCALIAMPWDGGKLHHSHQKRLDGLLKNHGLVPGPQVMFEYWAAIENDPDAILKSLGLSVPPLLPADASRPDVHSLSGLDALIADPAFLAFEKLPTVVKAAALQDGDTRGEAPYLTILPAATAKLLRGLDVAQTRAAFKEAHLEPLLHATCQHICDLIKKCLFVQDDFLAFLDTMHAIHDDIMLLVAVTKPYQRQDMHAILRDAVGDLGLTELKDVEAHFNIENAGMRGASAVLQASISHKRAMDDAAPVHVMALGHNYRESLRTLGDAVHGMRAEIIDQGKSADGLRYLRERSATAPKVDLLMCEFRHNIHHECTQYGAEDLSTYVAMLIDNDMAGVQLTVAIDTTMNVTDERMLKDFLRANAAYIASGKLNVVFYRSAQKFDMLGMSHMSGGFTMTANNPAYFAAFNAVMHRASSVDIGATNTQALLHYQKCAHDEMNDYRRAVMRSVSTLASMQRGPVDGSTPTETMVSGAGTPGLHIVPVTEAGSFFLDMRCIGKDGEAQQSQWALSRVQGMLQLRSSCDPKAMPLSSRAGFGFANGNIILIDGRSLRFTPGLESDELLRHYQAAFMAIDRELRRAVS